MLILAYYSGGTLDSHVYTDYYWASGRNARRSTLGYVVLNYIGEINDRTTNS